MSGPLLKFPLKPNEVADDIESFIHVFDFTALRFYRSSFAGQDPVGVNRSGPSGQPYSDRLAQHVWTFFYMDAKVGSHHVGGDYKFLTYMSKLPESFEIIGNTVFTKLLTELHKLCRKHYASLDMNALGKYAVGPCRSCSQHLPNLAIV